MMPCDESEHKTALYVDHELSGAEALELEAHLTECARCRLAYEDLRSVVDAVRLASPLYEIPERSYASAERLVAAQNQGLLRRHWLPLAAAAALLVGVALGSWSSRRPGVPPQYASFAAEAHLRYTRGAFPLDVVSQEPQVVSEWLGRTVTF